MSTHAGGAAKHSAAEIPVKCDETLYISMYLYKISLENINWQMCFSLDEVWRETASFMLADPLIDCLRVRFCRWLHMTNALLSTGGFQRISSPKNQNSVIMNSLQTSAEGLLSRETFLKLHIVATFSYAAEVGRDLSAVIEVSGSPEIANWFENTFFFFTPFYFSGETLTLAASLKVLVWSGCTGSAMHREC